MTGADLRAAGCNVDDAAAQRLQHYVTLLLQANERINLTGTREPQAFWGAHVCDSLALLPLIDETRPQSLLDLGSGGGLPGLVLACARPELPVTLLDATQKKLRVLEEIAAAIGLANVRVLWARAEHAAHDPQYRERFELVTARAVGTLESLLELSAGLVAPAGLSVFFKSLAAAPAETTAAACIAGVCGLELLGGREYSLPEPHGTRVLVCYAKRGRLRADLPRDGSRIAKGAAAPRKKRRRDR